MRRHNIPLAKSELRMGLADDMVPAINQRFPRGKIDRVIDAWERIRSGTPVTKDWDDKGSQLAASYIADIYTEPWHDINQHQWIASLRGNASIIRNEFLSAYSEGGSGLEGEWVLSSGQDAEAYGSGWQKLVIQDRVWDRTACDLFPKTTDIIKGSGVPSVEVFFAKQQAKSGVKPHTESTNFYITAHLCLEIPDGDCWVRVGKEKREWTKGMTFAFDSSFVHEMRNDGTSDQVGLVIKFWHPDITLEERNALEFIFDVLGDPSILEQSFMSDTGTLQPPTGESTTMDLELQESDRRDAPLDADSEAARLDGFLAGLKADGLLPGVSTPDQVLASKVPKNRDERRQTTKKGKRQGSSPRKKRKR